MLGQSQISATKIFCRERANAIFKIDIVLIWELTTRPANLDRR